MHQTEYKGLTTLSRNTSYIGGICKWWYTPVENIDAWPVIDPLTQEYAEPPTLVGGAVWHGPVKVPDSKLGLDELEKFSGPGSFFEISLDGFHPGDERSSRVNLQNMRHHRYIIVAKQRAGGFYLLVGTPQSPLKFIHKYNTGKGSVATAGTEFEFKTEHKNRVPGLATFQGDNSAGEFSNEFSNDFNI